MLRKKLLPVILISISTFAVSAQESDLSYSYVDIAYQKGDFLNADFDGFRVGMNAAVRGPVFVVGSYAITDFDDIDIDFKIFNIGLGFHVPIDKKIDFVASAEYVNYNSNILDEDEDGYRISAGVRARPEDFSAGVRTKPEDFFELSAFIHYSDIEDEDNTGLSLEARYFFSPTASFGLVYSKDYDFDTLDFVTFNARIDY